MSYAAIHDIVFVPHKDAGREAYQEGSPRSERVVSREVKPLAEGHLFALALWPYADPQLRAELRMLGVEVSFASTQQGFQASMKGLNPELLLIDPDTLEDSSTLEVSTNPSLIVLAAAARGTADEPIPQYIRAGLARSIAQIRTRYERV